MITILNRVTWPPILDLLPVLNPKKESLQDDGHYDGHDDHGYDVEHHEVQPGPQAVRGYRVTVHDDEPVVHDSELKQGDPAAEEVFEVVQVVFPGLGRRVGVVDEVLLHGSVPGGEILKIVFKKKKKKRISTINFAFMKEKTGLTQNIVSMKVCLENLVVKRVMKNFVLPKTSFYRKQSYIF